MKRLPSMLLALFVLPVILFSCKRIPLYDPEADVYLTLDYPKGADALPEMVRVCFYHPETHELAAETFLAQEGGFVDVASGVYDVLVYGLGTSVTRIDGTSRRGSAYAYTSYVGTRVKAIRKASELPAEYEVIHEPDPLWTARAEALTVRVHAAEDGVQQIRLTMEPFLENYSFSMPYVQGADHLAKADVYVTGQAAYKYLWDGRFPSVAVALQASASLNPETGALEGNYNSFGLFPDPGNRVFLFARITTSSGALFQYSFDVTEQITNPDNTSHSIILDEEVDIPETDAGSGFTPSVNDWSLEIIDIPLS